jgi:hypothetical protein
MTAADLLPLCSTCWKIIAGSKGGDVEGVLRGTREHLVEFLTISETSELKAPCRSRLMIGRVPSRTNYSPASKRG